MYQSTESHVASGMSYVSTSEYQRLDQNLPGLSEVRMALIRHHRAVNICYTVLIYPPSLGNDKMIRWKRSSDLYTNTGMIYV